MQDTTVAAAEMPSKVAAPFCEKDKLVIPNPKQGGQKTDTEKKRRLWKKTPPVDTPYSKTKVQKKAKKKTRETKAKKERKPSDDIIVLPAVYVVRGGSAKRGAEAYVLDAKPRDRWVCQQSKVVSEVFEANVEQVYKHINNNNKQQKRGNTVS